MQPEQVANIACLERKGFAIRVPKSRDPARLVAGVQAASGYSMTVTPSAGRQITPLRSQTGKMYPTAPPTFYWPDMQRYRTKASALDILVEVTWHGADWCGLVIPKGSDHANVGLQCSRSKQEIKLGGMGACDHFAAQRL